MTRGGPAASDDARGPLADTLHRASGCGAGRSRIVPRTIAQTSADPDAIELAVVGAHLSGLPLNDELRALGGRLLRETRTAGDYRLYALPGTSPAKPGLVREPGFAGPGVPAEVWSLAAAAFGRFVARIPPPLGIGRIAMADGSVPSGFLCERWAIEGAEAIDNGWRAFVAVRYPA